MKKHTTHGGGHGGKAMEYGIVGGSSPQRGFPQNERRKDRKSLTLMEKTQEKLEHFRESVFKKLASGGKTHLPDWR